MRRPIPDNSWTGEMNYVANHDRVSWLEPRELPHVYHRYRHWIARLDGLVSKLGAQTVLNVGCAQGTIDIMLAERGISVTAIEIRPGFLEYAKLRESPEALTRVNWVLGNLFEVEPPGGPFDLVMSHHVIEHVTDPEKFVSRLAAFSRPGGHVLVTTPSWHYMRNRLPDLRKAGDLTKYPHFENSDDGDDHLFAFRQSELVRLGEETGIEVAEHFFYGSFLQQGHLKTRWLARLLPSGLGSRLVNMLEPLANVPGIGMMLFANQAVLWRKPFQ